MNPIIQKEKNNNNSKLTARFDPHLGKQGAYQLCKMESNAVENCQKVTRVRLRHLFITEMESQFRTAGQ